MRHQRFDEGTHVTILGKPKFVTLADEIHNKKVFLKCLKNRWSEDIICVSQVFRLNDMQDRQVL